MSGMPKMCAIPQLVSAALVCENIRFSSLFAAGDVSLSWQFLSVNFLI